MFTGIIEKKGTVERIDVSQNQMKIKVNTQFGDLQIGESVAVNGVCLTVNNLQNNGVAEFYISPETLACTSLKRLHVGSCVNLERALKADMRLSGHIVQGHVDSTATLSSITNQSESHELHFSIPKKWEPYCIEKGSISIEGISLTVNTIKINNDETFNVSIMVIPHTWEVTNLSTLNVGDTVNIEVDILGKYMEKLCAHHLQKLNAL